MQQAVESLLLTATPINTFNQQEPRTNGSGFFFERGDRLFLVTSRHVLIDEPTGHRPDRLEIELHKSIENVAETVLFSIPLYRDGASCWRQAVDGGGEVDVAAIEIDRSALPAGVALASFTPNHLLEDLDPVTVGTPLLVVGFPLGFQDLLHRMPIARHAVIASSFGLRFQGEGYFLTDGRTHRGISGAPVVTRSNKDLGTLPWLLLGIHSARLDVGTRDAELDEALGLNCAWYADVLMTLTAG